MKKLYVIITMLFIIGMSNFAQSKNLPPINRDSVSGYISMTIDSGTCYSRYISARLYDNLLSFHHWERSNDGITFSNVSTSSTLMLSNISDKFWIRAVVKTGNDSCYTDTVFYNEVCAYDTLKIKSPVNAYLSGYVGDSINNYGSYRLFMSWFWTSGGRPNPGRSLMKFALTTIPSRSIIKKSSLYLFGDSIASVYHNSYGHSNESYLYRVDSAWLPASVLWKNQPKVDTVTKIYMPQIGLASPNTVFDITSHTQRWTRNPSLNYGVEMRLKSETPYASQVYGSGTAPDTNKRPYMQIIYYKPQIVIDTRGYNPNGDSIFYKAEVGNYRKTYYSGLKQSVILDSLTSYPNDINLKFYKKGLQNDTSIIKINVDSNFNIKTVKINKNGVFVNYPTDNYFAFDNKITFYAENSKKDDFSNYFKLNLKNGLKMILFPSGNTTSSDTIWSKLYVSGTVPTNSKFCLIIYDSFNSVVFKTYDPTYKWNGKINNVFIAASSYTYALYINDLIYRGQFFVEYK
jgi:hypothetical protein